MRRPSESARSSRSKRRRPVPRHPRPGCGRPFRTHSQRLRGRRTRRAVAAAAVAARQQRQQRARQGLRWLCCLRRQSPRRPSDGTRRRAAPLCRPPPPRPSPRPSISLRSPATACSTGSTTVARPPPYAAVSSSNHRSHSRNSSARPCPRRPAAATAARFRRSRGRRRGCASSAEFQSATPAGSS